jgi:hypothetical protein
VAAACCWPITCNQAGRGDALYPHKEINAVYHGGLAVCFPCDCLTGFFVSAAGKYSLRAFIAADS